MDSIRVLFVEDEDSEAALVGQQLQAHGIQYTGRRVQTEESLRTALHEFKPAVILSDFTLPGFDGMSALEIARALSPEVPFIFVSGTIGEERAIAALRHGAVDYVLKTNLPRLGPAVRRALDEAAARAMGKRQERQIKRLTNVLRMLSGINGAVVRIRDRQELLQEACRLSVAVGGYAAAIVSLRSLKTRALEPTAWEGTERDRVAKLCEGIEKRVTQEIKAGRVSLQAPTPIVFSEDAGFGWKGRTVTLPLVVDKTVVGVLTVGERAAGAVGEEEMRMLREVAANLSFALQYMQQDSRVKLLSYFDVLTGLAKRHCSANDRAVF